MIPFDLKDGWLAGSKALAALNDALEVALHTGRDIAFSLAGNLVGTVVIELQRQPGGAWVPLPIHTEDGTFAASVAAAGSYYGTVIGGPNSGPDAKVRLRCSAFTSGSSDAELRLVAR